jgi:cell wall-associated NlpC family hydrolase
VSFLTSMLAPFYEMLARLRRVEPAPAATVESLLAEAELPESVIRARSMVGRGMYKLGAGGRNPAAETPFDSDGRCDCSGFLAWCVQRPRVVDVDPGPGRDEVWFYTDQLEADARGKVKGDLGDGVPWEQAQPGDLVVYGAGPRVGHCGLVVEVGPSGPSRVVHCRSGRPPAVVETGADGFRKRGAVILRPAP